MTANPNETRPTVRDAHEDETADDSVRRWIDANTESFIAGAISDGFVESEQELDDLVAMRCSKLLAEEAEERSLASADVAREREDRAEARRIQLLHFDPPGDPDPHREKRLQCARAGGTGLWHHDLRTQKWWFTGMGFMIGESEDRFVDRPEEWLHQVHDDDRISLLRAVRALKRGEVAVPLQMKYRVRHRKGHWVCVRICGDIVDRDICGQPSAIAGSQSVVKESEFFGDHVVNSRMMVFAKRRHRHGKIVFVYVNEAFAEYFGLAVSDIVGKTDEELGIPPEQICRFRVADEMILDGDEDLIVVEKEELTLPDGRVLTLHTEKQQVFVGNTPYVQGIRLVGISEVG